MDLSYLTAILADRLTRIVPDGFHVAAADGRLRYSAEQGRFPGQSGDYCIGPAGTYVRVNFGVYGASDEENIVGVAIQALDELQDYISEATHMPWPGTTRQPRPRGRIIDSYLHLWYEDNDKTILACEPIPLDGTD